MDEKQTILYVVREKSIDQDDLEDSVDSMMNGKVNGKRISGGWDAKSHSIYTKNVELAMFQNTSILSETPLSPKRKKHLPREFPGDADFLVLAWNKWSHLFPTKVKNGWIITDSISLEDVALYIATKNGMSKLSVNGNNLSGKVYLWKGDAFDLQDGWESEGYFDDASPLLLSHVCRKMFGSGFGVMVRPLKDVCGWKVTKLEIFLLGLIVVSALVGVPKAYVTKTISTMYLLEIADGLIMKVAMVHGIVALIYAYLGDPFFYL